MGTDTTKAVGERQKPDSSEQPSQVVQSLLETCGGFVNAVVTASCLHRHLTGINPTITTVPFKIPPLPPFNF